jgi:hypothetical protein
VAADSYLPREQGILAWHCSAGRCGYGDDRPITTGVVHTVPDPIRLYTVGLHGSMRFLDALLVYARGRGLIVARTRHFGQVAVDSDNVVSTHREYLAVIDAFDVLHAFRESLAPGPDEGFDIRLSLTLLIQQQAQRASGAVTAAAYRDALLTYSAQLETRLLAAMGLT